MRIWDINPGYLNRQSLLGEHRELHGIASIIRNNKKGYARHPETLRWKGYGWALSKRHQLLAAEMALRGYVDKTPVRLRSKKGMWPETYIDPPDEQFSILSKKYIHREHGRIPLPENAQQLWSQHKYSVMARDPGAYESMGKRLASKAGKSQLSFTARELSSLLRQTPNERHIKNTLMHMWGYVSKYADLAGENIANLNPYRLLAEIRELAASHNVQYLVHSTALGEFSAWKY
jgi:uncharacterized protein YbgA (DUF1722 family)